MSERLLNLLGLMRKAGAIEPGETNSGTACRAGKGKLLILASDASDNARRRAESFVNGRSTVLAEVPYTKDELAFKLGAGSCSMAAITDLGFANAFMKGLSGEYPDKYTDKADALSRKLEKTNRRRKTKGTDNRNKCEGIRED